MAYSYVRYTGNGSTVNYSFPFQYLSADHVKVRINGELTTLFSFLNANTIQLFSAAPVESVIEIRRETPKDNPIVNFTDGSVLLERDLDLIATFDLYIAQESEDLVGEVMNIDSTGNFDAEGRRIKNVGDPVADGDAVNKGTLVYEYPKVSVVADNITSVNVVAGDLGAAKLFETDLGLITDNPTVSEVDNSRIGIVAQNIADVQAIADALPVIQLADDNAAAAAASATAAGASANSAALSAAEAASIISHFTISTANPTGGVEGDVWFKIVS